MLRERQGILANSIQITTPMRDTLCLLRGELKARGGPSNPGNGKEFWRIPLHHGGSKLSGAFAASITES